MEIKINIPKNDYVQPTEVREEVVQAICDAFLETHVDSIFHPLRDGWARRPTLYVHPKTKTARASFNDADWAKEHDGFIRFNGTEMKAAFNALIAAGYHMYEVYEYRTWRGYECYKKPHVQNATEVREFNDFID